MNRDETGHKSDVPFHGDMHSESVALRNTAMPLDSVPEPRQIKRRYFLAISLFVATVISTFLVGMLYTDPDTITGPFSIVSGGLQYSGALMLILLFHEMGHYLQSRRYRVPASLPYFIPMPIPPFGTMGAVILQAPGVADRKSLYDIAITGPLAGLVLALPFAYVGVLNSTVDTVPENFSGWRFGDPLLMQWMVESVHGPLADNQDVFLNPLLFAGWVGILITALNLVPIGQLDGGHILYTLIGRRSHVVAVSCLIGAITYMVLTQNFAYSLIIFLLLLTGARHQPTANDHVPLGTVRIILGWLTLAFLLIGLTPTPLISTG